jgi:hypothetical protein
MILCLLVSPEVAAITAITLVIVTGITQQNTGLGSHPSGECVPSNFQDRNGSLCIHISHLFQH